MHELIQESEVEKAVQIIFDDYNRGKHIDNIDIYNRPDQAEIQTILQNLIRVVYPGHFRDRSHKIYNPKNSFAVLIEDTFYHLHKQVAIALDYCKLRGSMTSDERKIESYRICKEFFAKIPQIREFLETDLHAAFDGDPAAGCLDEIILAYPGLMATTIYRIAHELYLLHVPVLPRLMTEYAHSKTGIDIHPGATIGKYFFIDHGTGIVIGETAVIGKNVKIYQGVTLGAHFLLAADKSSPAKNATPPFKTTSLFTREHPFSAEIPLLAKTQLSAATPSSRDPSRPTLASASRILKWITFQPPIASTRQKSSSKATSGTILFSRKRLVNSG